MSGEVESGKVMYIDAAEWQEKVLNHPKVIVDFYSDECPPCEALAPKFEGLATLYGDDIRFVKIFRQKNRELAEALGIKGSPTVIFYENGERVGDFLSGGVLRSQMEKNLQAMLDPDRVAEIKKNEVKTSTECDILILGGGPAGLTAAIYAAQAKKNVILVDPALPGGQVGTTHMVSNYPGFVEPQRGFMLAHFMSEQAKAAGTHFRSAVEITKLDLTKKEVEIDGLETISGKKMILATGSSPRFLGVPGEKEYKGQGISYCATCDGKYYDGKELIVIGGGNSAIEEALFLTEFATKITIVHQFDELQANQEAQERAFAHPAINFLMSHEPREFIRTERGMDVVVEDLKAKEHKTLSADGVFIFVGMQPNLKDMGESLELDDWGYVKVDPLMHTNIMDVFAAGDIASKPIRQITVATSEGTIAAVQAARELSSR